MARRWGLAGQQSNKELTILEPQCPALTDDNQVERWYYVKPLIARTRGHIDILNTIRNSVTTRFRTGDRIRTA